jgi:hypothetical protein
MLQMCSFWEKWLTEGGPVVVCGGLWEILEGAA